MGRKVGWVYQLLSESPAEGTNGLNIQVFEGSVSIGASGQSGYWEPKRITRSLKIPHLSIGTWQNSMWKALNRA